MVLENLGFHHINAFEKRVEWEKPACFRGRVGIENFRFGEVVTDILAEGETCRVVSKCTLHLRGKR